MMRRWYRHLAIGAGTILMLSVAGASTHSGGYSDKPLREPVRDVAANAVEFVKFNNWLNVKHETVLSERIQALKEHLYSIIDSHVKQLHARTGKTYPSEKDLILPGCFMWATRMGIPGADQVLQRLDPETAKLLKTSARLPDSFMLNLDGEHFVLSSSLGPWRATFPYYFMVHELRDFDATNGMRTQIAIVSTGFGRHEGSDGYSQATIMLVYAPMGADAQFTQYWMEKYGPDRRR